MDGQANFFLELITQFAGGPGQLDNNLVRYGLAAVLWAILLAIAWLRQRQYNLPREAWLVWGFGLAFGREFYMFGHVAMQMITGADARSGSFISEPLEHGLTMAAATVVAAAFLRYLLDDNRVAQRYLKIGLGATVFCFVAAAWYWFGVSAAAPELKFHQTWAAWLYHGAISALLATAIGLLLNKSGWLRNVVIVALAFLLLGEVLILINFFTDKAYGEILCPIGNGFHMLAIPLLGYVYIRELFIENKRATEALELYRNHLEDLVAERTAELTREVELRARVEHALAELGRRHQLMLNSAGEGIFGVDLNGSHTFVNQAAAEMLGYTVDDLIGRPSHATWHHSKADGSPYPEAECPLHAGYKSGSVCKGNDQVFWRKDGSSFPVRYISSPLRESGELIGAVVVFQNITQRKQAEAEITRLHRETEYWAERLALLHAISEQFTTTLDADTILRHLTEQSAKLLGGNVALALRQPATDGPLTCMSRYGLDPLATKQALKALNNSRLCQHMLAKPQTVALDNTTADHRLAAQFAGQFPNAAVLCLPLKLSNKLAGEFLLIIDRNGPRQWRADEVQLAESFVNRAAIALENAYLHRRVQIAAALEERQRIASEMHDGLAQTLSFLGYQIDQVIQLSANSEPPGVLPEFARIRQTIDAAAKEVRESIASLRQNPQPHQSLQTWLAETVKKVNLNSDTPIELISELTNPVFVPPNHIEQIVRVVQEALINASRHAQAGKISVRLGIFDAHGSIDISDDGQGFDPQQPAAGDHFGLSIMRARAARIGGRLVITSGPGAGTRVTLAWPLTEISVAKDSHR